MHRLLNNPLSPTRTDLRQRNPLSAHVLVLQHSGGFLVALTLRHLGPDEGEEQDVSPDCAEEDSDDFAVVVSADAVGAVGEGEALADCGFDCGRG